MVLVAGTPFTSISMLSASSTVAGIVAIDAGVIDALLAHFVFHRSMAAVGLRLDGVLHVHLQHQVAAAFKIQPQPDVVLQVVDQSGASTWESR